ncbi:hypothetical protein BDV25DRAFT_135260 [Aspergillus avenaceus]|uniref:Uncharacterized protein n=1 Tax=Aspergillus avenaceus TaxID=36643 RepID=A0A5N6UAJ6_ASPAV|nr:hypothetical protein BDV25DRAFT_135260 [Aspergillus avenaceus]
MLHTTPYTKHPQERLTHRPKPKGVQRARAKRLTELQAQALSAEQEALARVTLKVEGPNLFDRINNLPPELRLKIYAHLLIQPCKFDLLHRDSCTPLSYSHPGPSPATWVWNTFSSSEAIQHHCCASCYTTGWGSPRSIYVSPARSKWAPEPSNPYLCDNCYVTNIRSKCGPCPSLLNLKCLCARKLNLEILLVNRFIYEEASRVFWGGWFAFEGPELLLHFLDGLSERSKGLLGRVCLLLDPEVYAGGMGKRERKALVRCFRALRACTGLCEVEVDARVLADERVVLGLRNVRVKNCVRVMRVPGRSEVQGYYTYDRAVWVRFSKRVEVVGGLVDVLRRSMLRGAVRGDVVRGFFARS